MLQHTRETSINPLVAPMTVPKSSSATTQEDLPLEISEKSLEGASEGGGDFNTLFTASIEQSAQVPQVLNEESPLIPLIQSDSEVSEPLLLSGDMPVIEQAIPDAFPVNIQLKPQLRGEQQPKVEEERNLAPITVESMVESIEQPDETVQASVTLSEQQTGVETNVETDLLVKPLEQKVHTVVTQSPHTLEQTTAPVSHERLSEQPIENEEIQVLEQPQSAQSQTPLTPAAGQVGQVATVSVMQGSATRMQNSVQVHKTSQPNQSNSMPKMEEAFDEPLEASLLTKEAKANLQNSPMAQQTNSFQPGQQPLPPGMTAAQAAMAKNQAFMEQFRQQQTALKQQQVARAENMDATSADFSASGSKAEGINNLMAGMDKMASTPTSYQTISHSIHSKKWGEALGKHLVMAANRDIQKMQITLNPEKLGPIQVRLHMDKDRQLHVNLLANHALTREAMMEAMPRLRDMLESNGTQLVNLDVADHGFEQESFAESNSEGSGKGAKGSGVEVSDEELQVIPMAKLSAVSDSMVDYYA